MSKSLYIRILQPITGFRKNKIYTDQEVAEAGLDTSYMNVPENKYFKKLKVKSDYASMPDIVHYICAKYGLGELQNYSISHAYCGDTTLTADDEQRYSITDQEVASLSKEHIDEHLYCRTFRSFSVDVYLVDVLEKLVDDAYVIIDDALIQKALAVVSEELDGGELESLENFFEYDPGYEGKLIASMMVAQKLAEKVGGIAIMEYD